MTLGALDLYTLLVDNVFGGLLLAIIGIAILLLVIMVYGKLYRITVISVLIYYLMICGIYFSSLTLFFVVFGVIVYFTYSLIRFATGGLN